MEYLLILICVQLILITVLIIALFWKIFGNSGDISVTVKQEFSESDRQLLEDIYNEKGDLKNNDAEVLEALDEAVKNINNIMYDTEVDVNGEG